MPLDLAFPGWCRRMWRKALCDVVEAALLAAGAGIEYKDFHSLMRPFPIPDFRQVVSMFANVLFVLHELVAQELFEMRADALQARDAVDHVARQVKAIPIIKYGHIERCRCCSLFLVSTHLRIVMIPSPVGQAVNHPSISV